MIHIIGTGPGTIGQMTLDAVEALKASEIVVGYKKYIQLVQSLIEGKEIYQNGMKGEVERCRKVVELARLGSDVAMVSGGDAGIYGMAGIVYEILEEQKAQDIEVKVYPGITAAQAGAALLGAPIVHDSVMISLSDLLTDYGLIKKRLHHAGQGDFVISIYNPKSKGRPTHILDARDILLDYKAPQTPVGLVRNAYREDQEVILTTLKDFCQYTIDMSTVVIIGNKETYIHDGRMITPRGYSHE